MDIPIDIALLRRMQAGDTATAAQFEFGFLFAELTETPLDGTDKEPKPGIVLTQAQGMARDPFQFYKPYSKMFPAQ